MDGKYVCEFSSSAQLLEHTDVARYLNIDMSAIATNSMDANSLEKKTTYCTLHMEQISKTSRNQFACARKSSFCVLSTHENCCLFIWSQCNEKASDRSVVVAKHCPSFLVAFNTTGVTATPNWFSDMCHIPCQVAYMKFWLIDWLIDWNIKNAPWARGTIYKVASNTEVGLP